MLVGHSGAGLLLPIVGRDAASKVVAYVFVDAALPARAGSTPVVPAEFVADLEARAEKGRLPVWSRWWPEDVMRTLLPDDSTRRPFEAELPSLPVSFVRESVPVPRGWPDASCAYLQFSSVYEPAAQDAASRGWRTARSPGEHLHMMVDPEAVAEALVRLGAPMSG